MNSVAHYSLLCRNYSIIRANIQYTQTHRRKRKWLRQRANKMQLNLGFYWSRRRGTCIELLNKFTSFQFSSWLWHDFLSLSLTRCSLVCVYQKFSILSVFCTVHDAITFKLLVNAIHIWSPFILCANLIFCIVFKIYLLRFYVWYTIHTYVPPLVNFFMKWNFIWGIHRQRFTSFPMSSLQCSMLIFTNIYNTYM